MDEENWSTVEINILLDCGLVGIVVIACLESSVKKSETESHAPETNSFDHGEDSVVNHSHSQVFTQVSEPERVKVSKLSLEDSS